MLSKLLLHFTTNEGKFWAKGDQEALQKELAGQRRTSGQKSTDYLKANRNRQGSEAGIDLQTGLATPGTGLMGRMELQRNDLNKRFGDYAGTGGINENARAALQDNPGSIAGRIATPDYSQAMKGYQDMAATGGADLSKATSTYRDIQGGNADMESAAAGLRNIDYSGVNDSIGKLKELGATGGMSDADKANVLRPLYYENEKTGGYSDKNLADIKKEGNASISGLYGNMQDEMNRRRAASGYGGGFGANAQSMARQGAIESGNQDVRTNIGLSESVRQGKMSAADAIQRGQLGISDITGRVKTGALGSAGSLGLGVTGQQASNLEASGDMTGKIQQLRMAAAQGDVEAQRVLQSGKLAGLGGMTDITSRQGQFDLNRADLASGNVRALQGMEQQGQQYGMSGLSSMYGRDQNQLQNEQGNELQAMGMDDTQQARLLEIMQRNSMQPGKNQQRYGNILGGIGSAAGLLRGFGGVGGGFGNSDNPATSGPSSNWYE